MQVNNPLQLYNSVMYPTTKSFNSPSPTVQTTSQLAQQTAKGRGLFGEKDGVGGGGLGYAKAIGKGAAAGSVLGPIGMGIGALIGGIVHKVQNNKERAKNTEEGITPVQLANTVTIGNSNNVPMSGTNIPIGGAASLTSSINEPITIQAQNTLAPVGNTLSSVSTAPAIRGYDGVANVTPQSLLQGMFKGTDIGFNNLAGTIGTTSSSIANSPVNYTSSTGLVNVPTTFGGLVNLSGIGAMNGKI